MGRLASAFVAVAATGIVGAGALPATAGATTIGTTTIAKPWFVAMCKTSDRPTPPPAVTSTFFHDLLATPGKGLQAYFSDMSYNAISLQGTTITPWTATPFSTTQENRTVTASIDQASATMRASSLSQADVGKLVFAGSTLPPGTSISSVTTTSTGPVAHLSMTPSGSASGVTAQVRKPRSWMINDCLYSVTSPGQDLSKYAGILTIWDAPLGDVGAWGWNTNTLTNRGDPNHTYGEVLLDSPMWDPAAGAQPLCPYSGGRLCTEAYLAHEMLHGMGLQHSWGPTGEYGDELDVMSNMGTEMAVQTDVDPKGMEVGPGLNGLFRKDLGWVPANRAVDGPGTRTLTALGHPEASGSLVATIRVPVGTAYLTYEVELRAKDRWDAGAQFGGTNTAAVMIHTPGVDRGFPITTLANNKQTGWNFLRAGETYQDSHVKIHVNSIRTWKDSSTYSQEWQASVTLSNF